MYECDWWNMYQTDNVAKQHLIEPFIYNMRLREERLWEKIKSGSLLVIINGLLKYPRIFEKLLSNFHPSSRTLLVVELTWVPLLKNMSTKKEF